MVAASGKAAVANAKATGSCEVGMCLKYVRTWWEIGSLYPDAITAWREAKQKHPDDTSPPLGAPVFWQGGQHGHIAIYVGGPDMRSTDCTHSGDVSTAHGSWVRNQWGYDYLGWTGDLNGVDLPLDTGGGDEDVAKYGSFGGPGITAEADNEWRKVKLTDENADSADIHNPDKAALHLGPARYTAMLSLAENRHDEAATLLVRWVECDEDSDNIVSASTPHEYVLSSGETDLRDTYVDTCSKGNYIRAEVMARGSQVRIAGVAVKVIFWPT